MNVERNIYVCYQNSYEATVAEGYNTNILAIVEFEKQAQEVCCNHGDTYCVYKLNEVLDRIPRECEDTVWNENGRFIHYSGKDVTLK